MPIITLTDIMEKLSGTPLLLTASGDGNTNAIPEMSVHFSEMAPGSEVRPHIHDRVETYIFLTGSALVMVGDDIVEVATGDVAFAPGGVPHGIKVIGSQPLRFYAINTPPASTCPMSPAPEETLWKWNHLR